MESSKIRRLKDHCQKTGFASPDQVARIVAALKLGNKGFVVMGPVGSGKTTLLRSIAEAASGPITAPASDYSATAADTELVVLDEVGGLVPAELREKRLLIGTACRPWHLGALGLGVLSRPFLVIELGLAPGDGGLKRFISGIRDLAKGQELSVAGS